MATYVRTHTPGEVNGTSGTTVAATTAAVTVPKNTLIAIIAGDQPLAVTGLSKPVGETASWVRVARQTNTGTFIEVWAIKTTVAWAAALAVTATLNSSSNLARTIQLLEYSGVSTAIQTADTDSGTQTITVTTGTNIVPGDLLIDAVCVNTGTNSNYRVTSSATGSAVGVSQGTGSQRPGYRIEANARLLAITGAGGRSVTYSTVIPPSTPTNLPVAGVLVGLKSDDYAPDTPTLTSMASGGVIDLDTTNRATWTFSSANAVDNQSAYDLQYRIVGAGSWITVSATSTASYRDFAAGSLAAGDYEWQVRVYGALGKVSNWSASGYFTAAEAPDGPTITYPISGQSVDQFETATWSTPAQDAYRLRRVADGGGDPNPAVIYYDTGVVNDATARSLPLNFSVNNRAEHIQLQVEDDGLWSEWVDVPVDVSYTPPPAPTRLIYVDPATGSLLVVITNPAPTGDDPAAVSNNVYITEPLPSGEIVEQRRDTGISTNGSWRYWDPISGWDYTTIRVEAVAANGTTSSSEV